MLKNIIIIENGQEYQYEYLSEVVKDLLGQDYYDLNDNDKLKRMEMKAWANCLNNGRKVISKDVIKKMMTDKEIDLKNYFLIGDEMTYILSLLATNNVILLERKDSDVFTSLIDKSFISDNYIIVNRFAEELLKRRT